MSPTIHIFGSPRHWLSVFGGHHVGFVTLPIGLDDSKVEGNGYLICPLLVNVRTFVTGLLALHYQGPSNSRQLGNQPIIENIFHAGQVIV